METILSAVCDEFGVSTGDILRASAATRKARMAAAFVARRMGISYPPIGAALGNGALALFLDGRAQQALESDLAFAESLMRIVDRLEMDLGAGAR